MLVPGSKPQVKPCLNYLICSSCCCQSKIYLYELCMQVRVSVVSVCIFMYTYIHTYIYTHIYIYAYTHIHIHIYKYITLYIVQDLKVCYFAIWFKSSRWKWNFIFRHDSLLYVDDHVSDPGCTMTSWWDFCVIKSQKSRLVSNYKISNR